MVDLTEVDHDLLDQYLDHILTLHKDAALSLMEARTHIAHVVSLIANDEPDFRNYIRTSIDA